MYHEQGSVEKALQGEVGFKIGEVISEAWERTRNVKITFFGAFFVTVVIVAMVKLIFGIIFNMAGYQNEGMELQAALAEMGVNIVSLPIETPLMVAMMMMALKHVNGQSIKVSNIFDYYVYVWPLVFVTLLMYILISIGFVLLILPGIYLSVAYAFVYQLMVDKKMELWEAMETSRKAVTKCWFSVFGLMIANAIIILISALPLLIGLFWTLPMAMLSMGIVYTRLFGYDGEGDTTEAVPQEREV